MKLRVKLRLAKIFFSTLIVFFSQLFFLPGTSGAEEISRQSRELIFKQQDATINVHYDLEDGTYLFLGGVAGEGASQYNRRFPLLSTIDKSGNILSGTVFTQGDALKLSEGRTISPVLGFYKAFKLGDGFLSCVSMDWNNGEQASHNPQVDFVAKFEGNYQPQAFFEFSEIESNYPVAILPFAEMEDSIAVIATVKAPDVKRKPGRMLLEAPRPRFVVTLDKKLEAMSSIELPAQCIGSAIYNPAAQQFVTLPRHEFKDRNICRFSKDGKTANASTLIKEFTLNDMFNTANGDFILTGQLKPKAKDGYLNEQTYLMHFDKELNFISGVAFPEMINNLDNSLFVSPQGEYFLIAMLRDSLSLLSSKTAITAIIKITPELKISWAKVLEGTGAAGVRSINFRNDGSISVLAPLEIYHAPKLEHMFGEIMQSVNAIPALNSFALLELDRDGKEMGSFTKEYSPKTVPVPELEREIFEKKGQSMPISGRSLHLTKTEVPLKKTSVTLEYKTLGRPWDK